MNMAIYQKTLMLITFAGLLWAPGLAFGQDSAAPAQHVPLQKTIGGSASAKTEVEPSLIVMNADGVTLTGDKLTLIGVAPNSIIFADRPVRAAGHALTAHLLQEWESGSEGSFSEGPAQRHRVGLQQGRLGDPRCVVVLKNPKVTGDRLTFDVQVLEGELKGADGAASVFIDIIGLPFTPLSYAGVARRTARRAAWYGAAAHPYYPPPAYPTPYYPPRPRGYYSYPRARGRKLPRFAAGCWSDSPTRHTKQPERTT
jgi:hypothetical protein